MLKKSSFYKRDVYKVQGSENFAEMENLYFTIVNFLKNKKNNTPSGK